MWRQYHDTFLEELENYRGLVLPHSLDVVTGTLAAPLIEDCANTLMQRYPQVKIAVHAIRNDYFGGNVSVAGLVTGTDIIKQCKDNLQSDTIAVPEVMLRDEKDRFLDDITLPQLGEALGCPRHMHPHRRCRVLPRVFKLTQAQDETYEEREEGGKLIWQNRS